MCLPLSAIAGLTGVVRVIDADTWDIGGERVRLFGIDAPELKQTCTDAHAARWPCGFWATDQTRKRFEGRIVACERLARDRYRRTVARCSDDGSDVAGEMVRMGLALAYRRYSSDYVVYEKAAAINARGLHVGKVQPPAEFRAEFRAGLRAERAKLRNARSAPMDRACQIKGNISSGGERIFHQPGQRFFDRTRISVVRGERWFCSEAEALAAGWRRALR